VHFKNSEQHSSLWRRHGLVCVRACHLLLSGWFISCCGIRRSCVRLRFFAFDYQLQSLEPPLIPLRNRYFLSSKLAARLFFRLLTGPGHLQSNPKSPSHPFQLSIRGYLFDDRLDRAVKRGACTIVSWCREVDAALCDQLLRVAFASPFCTWLIHRNRVATLFFNEPKTRYICLPVTNENYVRKGNWPRIRRNILIYCIVIPDDLDCLC